MNKVRNPIIGSDIEVFLMHKQTKEVISAEGYIKGSKHMPFNFDPTNKFYCTSLDNVLAEFTLPPTTDKDAWLSNIQKSIDYINSILPKDICTATLPAARLNKKYLNTDNARLFGCDHDFCVWTRSINPKPKADPDLRSAGFHVHVGYEEPTVETNEELVKAFDLHLAVPGVLTEPDNERRKLYGKAGCFRMPDHGVEYRTLSGYFAASRELSAWVFDATKNAIKFVNDERIEEIDAVAPLIIEAVNNNDKTIAGNLVRQFNLEVA